MLTAVNILQSRVSYAPPIMDFILRKLTLTRRLCCLGYELAAKRAARGL